MRRQITATAKLTKADLVLDEQAVVPSAGPLEVVVAQCADLLALGLPQTCIAGKILQRKDLSDRTEWVEFTLLGMTYGVAHDYDAPWLPADTAELTVITVEPTIN